MSRLVVTGAGGFLGQAICAAGQAAGHDIVALTRADIDLTQGDGLAKHLLGADAIIHAAAGQGDDTAHARDTLEATATLLEAIPGGARLVLVSSFSVYAFDGLPDGAQLDETTPTDPNGHARDAYARAKIGQEKQALFKAQTAGLDLWIARPGAIFGPGRTQSARLGWHKAGRWICPGGDARLPAIHVADCAAALIAAATAPDQGWPEDLPIVQGDGHVRVLNLVSPDAPTQTEWLDALEAGKRVIIPRKALMRCATVLELIADVFPRLGRIIPTALRPQTLAARFKPLRYSTHRLEDRLGHASARSFIDAMENSRTTRT